MLRSFNSKVPKVFLKVFSVILPQTSERIYKDGKENGRGTCRKTWTGGIENEFD